MTTSGSGYVGEPPERFIDLKTRKGRLTGLSKILPKSTSEQLRGVAARLSEAAQQDLSDDSLDQSQLATEAFVALLQSASPTKQPLVGLALLRARAYEKAASAGFLVDGALTWAVLRDDPRQPVLVNNMMLLANLCREGESTNEQVVFAINGILHAHELLREYVQAMFEPILEKKNVVAEAVAKEMTSFLNLEWLPKIPIGLDRLRHSYAHGQASIHDGTLIVFKPGTIRVTHKLSAAELWNLLGWAKLTWETILLELLMISCHSAARQPPPRVELLGKNETGYHQFRIHKKG